MKTYEKLGIGIAAVALGFAAYQTYMTKNALDENDTKDESRSPWVGARENILNAVEGGRNWFMGVLGKGSDTAQDAKDIMVGHASGFYQAGSDHFDMLTHAGTSGLKYIYDKGANTGNAVRVGTGWFFTKAKSAMGNTYESARSYIPTFTISLGGLTGLFSKVKEKVGLGK